MSKKFEETFGPIDFPDRFGYTWNFTRDYYHRKRYHENGEVMLNTSNGEVVFKYHFFDNSYNAFVFMFPHGEKNKTRTRIFITNGI
jgi:hypothetical protein